MHREAGASPPDRVTHLAKLYREHVSWLERAIYRRFGSAVAFDDVAQETYVRVASSSGAAIIRSPRAFLMKIAAGIAHDQLRRRRIDALHRSKTSIGDVVEPDQVSAILLSQIIKGLPPTYREAFLLSRFGGLAYEEIAVRLSVSVKTVEWRISKALAYCADRLDL